MKALVRITCGCGEVISITSEDFVDMAKTPIVLDKAAKMPYTRDYRHACSCGVYHFHEESATQVEYERWMEEVNSSSGLRVVGRAGH